MEAITHIFEILSKKQDIIFDVWILVGVTSFIFMIIFDFLKNNGNIIADLDGGDIACIMMFMTLGPAGGTLIIVIYMKEYKRYREEVKEDSPWWQLREYGGWK